ncbi:MAG: right-handed parallel beta-helix repeat-containing protein [Planctomycetota bacterium]
MPLAPQIAAVSQVRRGPAAHVVASKPITVWYVTPSGAGTGNGTSWGNAFAGLQGALAVAGSGDQIWVAEGLYTPSTSDASVSFVVPSGARLYGGFVGTETQLSQRDPALHVSHLSGDIGQDDILTNWPTGWNIQTANSGHILDVSGCAVGTVVDGFEISNGAIGPVGTGAWDPLMNGGGIYANAGNVTVRNCQFHHNLAAFGSGGCIFVFDGVAQVENCSFDFNFVHGGAGAGIAMYGTSQVQVADCSFYGNHAKSISSSGGDGDGTSIYATGTGNLVVRRSRFENNRAYSFYVSGSALGYGAGITTWVPAVVEDCEFVNNTAHLGSGFLTFSDALVVNCLFQGNTAVTLPNDPYPEGGGFRGRNRGVFLPRARSSRGGLHICPEPREEVRGHGDHRTRRSHHR